MPFICQKLFLFGKFEVNFHILTPLLRVTLVQKNQNCQFMVKFGWVELRVFSFFDWMYDFGQKLSPKFKIARLS